MATNIVESPLRDYPQYPSDNSVKQSTHNHSSGSKSQTSTITSSQNSLSQSSIPGPHNLLVHQFPAVGVPAEAKNSIKLQNCVATVSLNCELNLSDINCRTRNSEYRPGRFTGLIMRIREPRCTALIFRSGKLVCTGARTEQDTNLAARKMARIIQKLGYPVHFTNFKIQNLVATVDLRFPIRLEDLYGQHCQFSSYEPELFPGLIYRMVTPRVVLLIFVNGKIVFTGAKTRDDITLALDKIYETLLSYKKK